MTVMPLPDRAMEVTGDLPYPFRRSQLDSSAPAFVLTPAGPVVCTDAWSGRQLALWDGTRWNRLTNTARWHTCPQWTTDGLVAQVSEDLASERSTTRTIIRRPADGLSSAEPDHDDGIALVRRNGSARRVVFTHGSTTSTLDAPVTSIGPRLTPDELVVVVETWPGRVPYAWNTRTGDLRALAEPRSVVVDHITMAHDTLAFSWCSTEQPRRLTTVERARLQAGHPVRLTPDEPAGEVPPPAGCTVVDGPRCSLPCLLRDPSEPPRGTVLLLHGGPNGAHLGTWSPLAEALVLRGWRVVQPNIRGSRLLAPALAMPTLYGADDAEDVVTVVRELGTGPIVVGGVSYGGYLAARTALLDRRIQAVFLLSGFLRLADLHDTRHPAVREFVKAATHRFTTDDDLSPVPHFIAHGALDPRIPVEAVMSHGSRLASGSQIQVVETEGHGIVTDQAARTVFPTLFEWLETVEARGRSVGRTGR